MSVARRVVVAIPTIDDAARWADVTAVRDRRDPLASAVAPHLTLVFPFEDPLSDGALRDHVRGAVSGIRRFGITLCGITAHENEYLFLNVKRGNDELIRLRDALHAGPLAAHRLRTVTFVPHLTVGRVASRDLPAALEETSSLTEPIEARIDRVTVYRVDPDGGRPVLFEEALDAGDAARPGDAPDQAREGPSATD